MPATGDRGPNGSSRPDTDSWVSGNGELSLADIPLQQEVELVRIDLPHEQLEPLLERGMLPGCRLCPVRRSPFGDPIVMLDGTLLALRREMADCLCVRHAGPPLD